MTVTQSVIENVHAAVAELSAIAGELDDARLTAVRDAVLAAHAADRKVFVTGSGRSGLMGRAVAMRLMHIGLRSYAVGEIATPAIGPGDLLIAISARGGAAIVDQIGTAHKVGATVAAFSSAPTTAVAEAADLVVVVPAKTTVASAQHAGSLFEQTCLIAGDALCRAVQGSLGVATEELNVRHANLA